MFDNNIMSYLYMRSDMTKLYVFTLEHVEVLL